MSTWNSLVPELLVRDYQAARKFYTEVLGFTVRYERQNPDFGYFEQGGLQIMLEASHPHAWITGDLTPPLGRGINLQLELPDLAEIEQRLRDAGHAFFRERSTQTYEVGGEMFAQSEFLIQDPDGYLLRFVELRPDDAARDQLLGVWNVEAFTYTENGETKPWRDQVTGTLIYEASGRMSLAINSAVHDDHPYDSIFFYTGTFSIDGEKITHDIKNASNPNRIGKRLVRHWDLHGDRLTLSGSDAFGTGQIVFVRANSL